MNWSVLGRKVYGHTTELQFWVTSPSATLSKKTPLPTNGHYSWQSWKKMGVGMPNILTSPPKIFKNKIIFMRVGKEFFLKIIAECRHSVKKSKQSLKSLLNTKTNLYLILKQGPFLPRFFVCL
jgi:hypothetical protein